MEKALTLKLMVFAFSIDGNMFWVSANDLILMLSQKKKKKIETSKQELLDYVTETAEIVNNSKHDDKINF